MFQVGLIRQDSSGSTEGYTVLEAVFDELASAYATANADVGGYTLSKLDFETDSDVDDYVHEFNYKKKGLCFVLGWNEFSPSEHKFAIDLRWNYGTILNTRLPQVEYEESSQNQLYLLQYASTGFLQAMTSVTNKILSEVYGSDSHSIQMLYMPMNSGEFQNDGYSEVIGALIPITIFSFINLYERVKTNTTDTNEDKA